MSRQILPINDHISRYCKPTSLDANMNISAASFYLRTIDGEIEECVSVDWLEIHKKNNIKDNLVESVKAIRKRMKWLNNNGKIAVLEVGTIHRRLKEGRKSAIIQQLKDSHCGIYYRSEHLESARILADECITRIDPVLNF